VGKKLLYSLALAASLPVVASGCASATKYPGQPSFTQKVGTSEVDRRYSFLQFMVDCAVVLNHRVEAGVSQRSLRVQKYRGSAFDENESPFLIGDTGLEVATAETDGESFGQFGSLTTFGKSPSPANQKTRNRNHSRKCGMCRRANLMPGVSTMFDDALHRPAGLRIVERDTGVRLDWKDGSGSEEVMFKIISR
jgi:hypothetical protein